MKYILILLALIIPFTANAQQQRLTNATNMNVTAVGVTDSLGDWVNTTVYGPQLYQDFTQQYIPTWMTCLRASAGTYFDSSGTLQTASNNVMRYNHNFTTLVPQGLLYEEQRTNELTNNSMIGTVTGSPGTLPTGWTVSTSQGGITRTLVATGTEYGMPYLDLKYTGTASNATPNATYLSAGATAAQNEIWSHSMFARVVTGSTTNVTHISIGIDEETSGGSFLAVTTTNIKNNITGSLKQYAFKGSLTNASTGKIQPSLRVIATNGAYMDITMRLYGMQLEELSASTKFYPSSLIFTTGSAATRAADQCTFVQPSGATSLRYLLGDDTTQDVSQSYGSYTIPTTLNSDKIKRITGR